MNTCDHYNYVKTKAYAESSKETCVCDSYNLSLDQALKYLFPKHKTFATVKKGLTAKI